MQERINDIEKLVNEFPDIRTKDTEYKTSYSDADSIHEELQTNYKKLEKQNNDGLLKKVKDIVKQYITGDSQVTYSDLRKEYVDDLTRVTKECKSALFLGSRTQKKISELEEKITMSLLSDKSTYLKFSDYLTKLQDAISYTESQLEEDNSLEEESVLRGQLNQLREKENDAFVELDQVSIRIKQTSLHKNKAKEYIRYAQTQSYKIQQTLQTAEYTIGFLEATEGLGEFLKAGSLAAKLHKIFDKSKELGEETDELFISALNSLDGLGFSDSTGFSFKEANNFASQKLRKDMTERINEAKGIVEGM